MFSLSYIIATLLVSSTLPYSPPFAQAIPTALAEGPAGTGGPDPCISGHLCNRECCAGHCDIHTGTCIEPNTCGGSPCNLSQADCINDEICCPKNASCGSICCFQAVISFTNQVCMDQSIGLCCNSWQINAGGICCSPGEVNWGGKCVRELCPGNDCRSLCQRFPEVCNTVFSG